MEQYKIIKDFENYSVSNLGNVRNNKTGRVLKLQIDTQGYYKVNLYKDRISFTKNIHKLGAESFIANPYNKPFVDHINNNKLDNNINNLRWATIQENSMNTKLNSRNSSNYKGICYSKLFNRWNAYITINGKMKNLGYFKNLEDAVNCRVKKAKEVYGEYINSCEKEVVININIPTNTKVNLNININPKEDQEIEDLEKEFIDILNKK
jgi:hypothetical protein